MVDATPQAPSALRAGVVERASRGGGRARFARGCRARSREGVERARARVSSALARGCRARFARGCRARFARGCRARSREDVERASREGVCALCARLRPWGLWPAGVCASDPPARALAHAFAWPEPATEGCTSVSALALMDVACRPRAQHEPEGWRPWAHPALRMCPRGSLAPELCDFFFVFRRAVLALIFHLKHGHSEGDRCLQNASGSAVRSNRDHVIT